MFMLCHVYVMLYIKNHTVLKDIKGDTDMSVVLKFTCILLLVIINFQVKKIAFVGSDSIGLTIAGKESVSSKETFILSSSWQAKRAKRNIHVRSSMQSFLCLLILMSGDIESCPGPYSRDIPALKQLLKQRGLAVFHQNVRGLFSNINLVSELFQSFSGIDILTLSETHIQKDSENNGLYDIPGYSFETGHEILEKGAVLVPTFPTRYPGTGEKTLRKKNWKLCGLVVNIAKVF